MSRKKWFGVLLLMLGVAFVVGAVSPPAITALAAALCPPTNLTAQVATSTPHAILLKWKDNSNNELGFSIERGQSTSTFNVIATTTANVTSYLDTGLASSTYYYRARAFDSVDYSIYSNIASSTIR